MLRHGWGRVTSAVGLACALGFSWALSSSRVPDVQELQPLLEIPLYQEAQIEWEVRLAAQEMPKGVAEWAQLLSVLRVAEYMIEGERALEALSFYDQALSAWQQVVWVQPTEAGGVRLFRKEQSYLFIAVSKRYEATDLFVATAQADEAPLDVPIFAGAQPQWEVLLTSHDLLEHLKRWFKDIVTNPPAWRWGPEQDWESLAWLGWLGTDMIFQLLQDLSELRGVGYHVDSISALQVLDFYEQQFGQWRRNLWIKPEESGSIRVFTRSDAQGLHDLVAVIVTGGNRSQSSVIVLRARR